MLILSKIQSLHSNIKKFSKILNISSLQYCCGHSSYLQLKTFILKSPAISCEIWSNDGLFNQIWNIRTFTNSSYLLNHYDVLGVKQSASKEEIKNAYIKLSKIYHPDKLLQDYKSFDAKDFLKIKEAFDVLSNDNRRLEYDMKIFGRSSDFNRFSTGEYSRYDNASKETSHAKESAKDKEYGKLHEEEVPLDKLSLQRLQPLLSQVYAFLVFCGIALYILSKQYRKKS